MEPLAPPSSMETGPPHPLDQAEVCGRADLSGLYHLGRTLGRGHFAVVKLGRHVTTGQLVAIKMIDKTKLDVMATSHLLQEVRCMRLVQHPNVVRLYEAIDTPTTLHLVMELAEGGDLYDYILRHEGGVAERAAKRHFAQVARAVAYCHRLHVVHRDLKPENVVFFPRQGAVKLTDFGFSNLFQPGTMLATSCGSLAYSAPEILLGEQYHAPAVDIWSLGVILYMLVCGVPPFQETNDSETLVMILDCRYSVPEHVSDGCRDLISRMLQKDPACRATLAEIEAHDWLAGLDDALLSPEAPPHWLSGALSASSLRPGLPESGDLLAARPPALQPGPGTWQPSLGHRRAPPEAPVVRTPAALGQICEDEEEEEEEEEEDEDEGEGVSSRAPPQAPQESAAVEPEPARPLGGEELQPANAMELGGEGEDGEDGEGEGEGEGEAAFGSGGRGGRRVISDQPVGNGNEALGCGAEGPPSSGPRRFMGVQCCHGEPDPTAPGAAAAAALGAEPNNNANAPLHLPPPQTSAPLSALPSPPSELSLNGHGAKTPGNAVERDDSLRDQAHNASGSETAGRTEPSKARSIKLKDRLFQFPLCEKALAFNIPTHNKAKVLPLAQYNCCHVL